MKYLLTNSSLLPTNWLIDWFSHRIHNRRQAIIKRSVHIIQQSCICHYAVPAYRDKREPYAHTPWLSFLGPGSGNGPPHGYAF